MKEGNLKKWEFINSETDSESHVDIFDLFRKQAESGLIADSYKSGAFRTDYSLDFVDKVISALFSSFDEILFKNEEFELDKAMIFLDDFITFLKHGLKA